MCDISTRGFLNKILLHIQCTSCRSNLWFFIHFYYSQVMKTFSPSFYGFLIHIQTFFNDYDATTLQII